MHLSFDNHLNLMLIAETSTLAEAVALIPDEWGLTLMGGGLATDPAACSCSIIPSGLTNDHMISRLAVSGLTFGLGRFRHEAIVNACKFILARCSRVGNTSVTPTA